MGVEKKRENVRCIREDTKGVRGTYMDAEGLALLQPSVYLSADQS